VSVTAEAIQGFSRRLEGYGTQGAR